MADTKLEPCPFCGGTTPKVCGNGIGDFYVICAGDEDQQHCEASTSDRRCETEQGAIDRWNRRTPAVPESGEVRGLTSIERRAVLDAMEVTERECGGFVSDAHIRAKSKVASFISRTAAPQKVTKEEIERAAKRMQQANALAKLADLPWDSIDPCEREHWIYLADAALSLPVEPSR